MNRPKTCRHIANAASLLSLPCILACSSAGPLDDKSYQESGTPHEIVLEAKWSDTGRFQVVRDESGRLGMAVTGIIGKDDPRAVSKFVQPSFVDTYRSLLPKEAVPPLLAALDARRSPIVATTDQAPVVKLDPIDTALASQSGFIDTVCHNFSLMSCSVHTPMVCTWRATTNFVETTDSNVCPSNSDASFFWNMMNATSSHALSGVSGSGYAANPNSWGWHSWWTGYPCAPPHLWNASTGELGVTNHRRVAQPCVQGEISE